MYVSVEYFESLLIFYLIQLIFLEEFGYTSGFRGTSSITVQLKEFNIISL